MPSVNVQDVRTAIYIDFEGNVDKPPTLLGAQYVDLSKEITVFNQYVHEEIFYSAGAAKGCINFDLNETFDALCKIARRDERMFFAWSTREKQAIEEGLTNIRLKDFVLSRLFDCKKIAKRWKNRFHPKVDFPYISGQGRHRLNEYAKLIDYPIPNTAGPRTAGKRLRDVRQQLALRDGSYEQITGVAKRKWVNLLTHNRLDCEVMMEVSMTAITDLGNFRYK